MPELLHADLVKDSPNKRFSSSTLGRPTKYKPEYCELVLELANQGHSKASICRQLNVDWNTWDNWERNFPDFLNTTRRAKQLSLGWWEDQGKTGIWSRDFNAQAYSLQIRNRFPDQWRDKIDVESSGTVTLRAELASAEQIRQSMIEAGELSPDGRLLLQDYHGEVKHG